MEISNFLKGSRYDSLIILTARKSSCKHVGYTLSDIHNETESIRTHPENNCSWFREARKSRDILGKRFSVTSTLDGLCLKTAPHPSLQGTPRKNTMARRVGDVQFEGERTLDRNVA